MTKLKAKEYESFENTKQSDENGAEYWFARDMQRVLQYTKWENFNKVIDRAMLACKNSGLKISNHFFEIDKMIEMPTKPVKNAKSKIGFPEVRKTKTKPIIDYKLTRYACYQKEINA